MVFILYNKPTCFKSKQGSNIDLLLTNKSRSFKHTNAFETGLSDYHLLVYTMFRITFEKIPPIKIKYRSYKYFDSQKVSNDILTNCSNVDSYETFEKAILSTLDCHAPIKSKKLRSNTKPFMNKFLRKAIAIRSRLKNKANKSGLDTDIENYKRQRNFVVALNRKAQKSYFSKLNPSSIQTSKSFFQTFKPYFSNKYTCAEKLLLLENGGIVSNDKTIAECFNDYFVNITHDLDIKEWPTTFSFSLAKFQKGTDKAISKYSDHPSILKINEQLPKPNLSFVFRNIEFEELRYEIQNLNPSKGCSGDIPIQFIKDYVPFYIEPLLNSFNNAINGRFFPDLLKLVDVTPVFKKGNKNDKVNYRPISVMKAFAIVFERLLFKQLNSFIESSFSPLLCGFRKGHSTQHALINLLENWRTKLENKQVIGTILCDLSKAFDTLPHDLLIAKLNAYGLSSSALDFLYDYLTNRKQRCKVGSSFSSWRDITSGVPQGSVMGPLLFNIFLNDFFFFIEKSSTTNFADDNTIYASGDNIEDVIYKLETDIENALNWFYANGMVANPNKFQIMFLGTKQRVKLIL